MDQSPDSPVYRVNKGPVRLYDWNQSLGTILVSLLFFSLTTVVIFNPKLLAEDGRWKMYVAVIAGPLMGIWALYRTVYWVELGEQICFQRIYGKQKCEWGQISHLQLDSDVTRYGFGLIKLTNHYLRFVVSTPSGTNTHSFRVTKKSLPHLGAFILAHRPDLLERPI